MTPVPAARVKNTKNVAIQNSANMFFLPIGCLIFALFILFLPVLFILGYFQVLFFGQIASGDTQSA